MAHKRTLSRPMAMWHRKQNLWRSFTVLAIVVIIAALGVRLLMPSMAATDGLWLSGVAAQPNDLANAKAFADWRGSPLTMVGCWDDPNRNYCMTAYKGFTGSIDVGPGFLNGSETYAQAAAGSVDARWKAQLQAYQANWGSIDTLYLRPAHEMNGNWFGWSIRNSSDAENFKKAWVRYYNLVQSELVSKGRKVKMVMGYNWDSKGISIDSYWPGDQYVDVVGADYYDADYTTGSPKCYSTPAQWDNLQKQSNRAGMMGPNAWLAFSKEHGKPFSFPEWGMSNAGQSCDDTLWVQNLHNFMSANAGSGAGQFLYDIYFNFDNYGSCRLWPNSQAPKAAALYKSLKWGSAGTVTPPTPPTTPPSTTKSPDLNADGKVNLTDLSMLLAQWGKTGTADLNTSGKVDLTDLSILLVAWKPS